LYFNDVGEDRQKNIRADSVVEKSSRRQLKRRSEKTLGDSTRFSTMIIRSTFLVIFALFAAPVLALDCGDLADAMAAVCIVDPACSVHYIDPSDVAILAGDIESILQSHGFGDGSCSEILGVAADDLLLGLSMDLSIACADLRQVADVKSTVYTTGLMAVILALAIVAFLALFAVMSSQWNKMSSAVRKRNE
jgi:hypothetical protein